MRSGRFEEKYQGTQKFTGDRCFTGFVALLTGNDNVRMIGATDVGAENVAAVGVSAMQEVYALKVCDYSIEGNFAELFGLLMTPSQFLMKLGNGYRMVGLSKE